MNSNMLMLAYVVSAILQFTQYAQVKSFDYFNRNIIVGFGAILVCKSLCKWNGINNWATDRLIIKCKFGVC